VAQAETPGGRFLAETCRARRKARFRQDARIAELAEAGEERMAEVRDDLTAHVTDAIETERERHQGIRFVGVLILLGATGCLIAAQWA